eukprot:Hpha_TRINITY_DN4362_c0_g1::TRINITY_DN4362_c0_g1_i1::g.50301::m.50301
MSDVTRQQGAWNRLVSAATQKSAFTERELLRLTKPQFQMVTKSLKLDALEAARAEVQWQVQRMSDPALAAGNPSRTSIERPTSVGRACGTPAPAPSPRSVSIVSPPSNFHAPSPSPYVPADGSFPPPPPATECHAGRYYPQDALSTRTVVNQPWQDCAGAVWSPLKREQVAPTSIKVAPKPVAKGVIPGLPYSGVESPKQSPARSSPRFGAVALEGHGRSDPNLIVLRQTPPRRTGLRVSSPRRPPGASVDSILKESAPIPEYRSPKNFVTTPTKTPWLQHEDDTGTSTSSPRQGKRLFPPARARKQHLFADAECPAGSEPLPEPNDRPYKVRIDTASGERGGSIGTHAWLEVIAAEARVSESKAMACRAKNERRRPNDKYSFEMWDWQPRTPTAGQLRAVQRSCSGGGVLPDLQDERSGGGRRKFADSGINRDVLLHCAAPDGSPRTGLRTAGFYSPSSITLRRPSHESPVRSPGARFASRPRDCLDVSSLSPRHGYLLFPSERRQRLVDG